MGGWGIAGLIVAGYALGGLTAFMILSIVMVGGHSERVSVSYEEGHQAGFNRGKHQGYQEGYCDGHADGRVAESAKFSNR